jgi:copper chaperone CopZ
MFRRDFLQRVTVAGASGLVTIKGEAKAITTVKFRVKGFSCVTCAVGLEVMLRERPGITRAKATYPSGIVVIGFNPKLITEDSIKEFIRGKGFSL